MTELAVDLPPATAPDTWSLQLAQLKARYKHVRPPILVALNLLLHDQHIALDDAKAQANLHGVRITAASMNAARTLLSRMDAPAVPASPAPAAATTSRPAATPPRTARKPRAAEQPDVEAVVRSFVAKLQTQGSAEAERLRDAMRKAVAVLQAAVS